VAVQLPNNRDLREGAQRGLVGRGQMVEVKQLRVCRAGTVERVCPDIDQPLVRFVIDRREDAIGRARPILVRRLERHTGLAALPIGRIVDGDQIVAAEEGRRMSLLPHLSERAHRQCHLPGRLRQRAAECARDLSRAAAREEEQAHNDPAAAEPPRGALSGQKRVSHAAVAYSWRTPTGRSRRSSLSWLILFQPSSLSLAGQCRTR